MLKDKTTLTEKETLVLTIKDSEIAGLRDEINAALAPLAAKHGVTIQAGRASYTPGMNCVFKLEVAAIKQNAVTGEKVVLNKEASDFKRYASRYMMSQDDLFRMFNHNGTQYKIIGARPRKTLTPIIGQGGGKRFVFAASYVRANLVPHIAAPVLKPVNSGLPARAKTPHITRVTDLKPGMGMLIWTLSQFHHKGGFSNSGKMPGTFNLVTEGEGMLLAACETEQDAIRAANTVIDMENRA